MTIYTVFVEPKTSGNIGFLARCMKNFGLKKLILIKPCKLKDDAYYQAMHAKELVENAQIYETLDEFIEDKQITQTIATTGTPGGSYNIPRIPITASQMGEKINPEKQNIALLFGREGDGLSNEELEKCDTLVTIPTSEEYPIMNITHAASIIFYEIYKNTQKTYPIDDMDIADYEDKQVLNQAIDEITQKLDYPDYKQKQVNILAKRIIGRAFITGRELRTMRGLLNRINKRIENKQEE
ncbi:TrmJ/YjtD family RNA methyltransferase [Methanosphaera cuniculi]|uniref:RNA methyltransferase n=1 Tax=Methanosphaera cuniculi TaxID=1077256 RepID=A0A2A2HCN5_9EURY|nr:TrmJ/YjtD family RNA methyltransferase [Methanosphaera cuniculi]PAV07080.1 RNA methyltransferase [Methanosphaera cuniculi]PWL07594.1 putative tRNA/rRNA methyltransferase [Methanosphaera cuniculi]